MSNISKMSVSKGAGLLFALVVLAWGLGCSGGAGDDPLPGASSTSLTASLRITGNIYSSSGTGNDAMASVLPASGISGAEVFLESNPGIRASSGANGAFVLGPVPPGSHRVIARLGSAPVYKARSGIVSVSDSSPEGKTGMLVLAEATGALLGTLRDPMNNPIPNATVSLWGESVSTNSNGEFTSPKIPVGQNGTLSLQATGFQTVSMEVPMPFSTPSILETTLAPTGETNHPPLVSLSASALQVSPGGTVQLTATAQDAESQALTIGWETTLGSVTPPSGNLSVTWFAPDQAGVATISFIASDSTGLKSRISVQVSIGGGGVSGAPSVTGFFPAANAVDVGPDASLWVTFSEAMDPLTLTGTNIQVTTQGLTIPLIFTIFPNNTTVSFRPSSPLARETLYAVHVLAGVRDAQGTAMGQEFTWNFTTAAEGGDLVPPTISGVYPAENAIGVTLNSKVSVTFSEAIDPNSLSTATFSLASASTLIPGTIALAPDGRTATFTPSSALPGGALLTAAVTTGIRDLAQNALANGKTWNFSTLPPDAVPPQVSQVSPANGATGVPLSTAILVTFSEPVDPTTVNVTTITLASGGTGISGTVSLESDPRIAVFRPAAALPPGSLITAQVTTGVRDLAGNNLQSARTWSFTTSAAPDTTPPTILAVAPPDGSTNVATSAFIAATFDEPMDPGTVNATTFTLFSGSISLQGTVNLSGDGRIARFSPTGGLPLGSNLTAQVTTGVKDLSGNGLQTTRVWSFKTTSAVDTTPPTILAVNPPENSTNVATTAIIAATFNEAMDPGSINPTTFTLSSGTTPLPGTVSLTGDGLIARFTSSGSLPLGTTLTALLTTGARDLAGNALAQARVWSFTTVGGVDTTPPTIISVNPAENATGVLTSVFLVVTFSEPMDPATINPMNIRLMNGGVPVLGAVTPSPDNRYAIFTPGAALATSTVYTGVVTTGVRDAAGNALASAKNWTFTTTPTADTTPPSVFFVRPTENETNVPLDFQMTVVFNESMDPSTIHSGNIGLYQGTTKLSASVLAGPGAMVATITPLQEITPGTDYTAVVESEVKDVAGNRMGVRKTWQFTTTSVPDTTQPFIVDVTPVEDATGVPQEAQIVVHFSERMDSSTITNFNLSLSQGATAVPGTISIPGDLRAAVFSPNSPLQRGTTYTFAVNTLLRDLAGNSLQAGKTWSFTTTNEADTTPPTVLSVVPPENSMGVPVSTSLTITFSEAMDAATLNSINITLASGTTPISGTVIYSQNQRIATFVPDSFLPPFSGHLATLKTGLKDLAGNSLQSQKMWGFVTGAP